MDNTFKNVYEKLESYILNKTTELSINEYKSFLGVHANNGKSRINNSIIIELIKGLENKSLTPNKLVDIIIDNINNDEYLLVLSLLLRNGADPNKSVMHNNQEIPLLCYVNIVYQNNISMCNTILLLLLLSGAEITSSITEQLKQRGINSILNIGIDTILNNIDKKLITKVATLLDRADLIKDFNSINITEIIRDHSNQVLLRVTTQLTELNKNGRLIDLCIKYYNEKAFNVCMNYGIKLKYHQINLLAIQIKLGESLIIKNIIKNMLTDYINHGGIIDKYQLDIINKKCEINKSVTSGYILNNLMNAGYSPDSIRIHIKKSYIEHGGTYSDDVRLEHPKKGDDFIDLSSIQKILVTPDMFEDIIYNKKVNDIDLSNEYLSSLYFQRTLLKRLGFTVNKSKSKINESCINDEHFNRIEKAFGTILRVNLDENINNLSVMNMEEILIKLEGGAVPLLNMLTVEHYRRTFAIMCHEHASDDLEVVLSLFY